MHGFYPHEVSRYHVFAERGQMSDHTSTFTQNKYANMDKVTLTYCTKRSRTNTNRVEWVAAVSPIFYRQ